MNTPNYNETNISGQTWQRSHHVTIQNPLGNKPLITFGEEKVFVIGDRTIKEFVGTNLSIEFNPENPKHLAIYMALNDLYIELRELRDNPAVPVNIQLDPLPSEA